MAQITRKPVDPGVMIRTGTGKGPPRMASFAELGKLLALKINGGGSGGGSSVTPANPTATASDVAVNGALATYMRSDAAPAVQKGDNSQFGLMKTDNATLTATAGVASIKNTAVTPATYGDATHVGQFTVDQQGRITFAANVVITAGSSGNGAISAMITVPASPGWDPQFIGLAGDVTLSNSNKTATPTSAIPYNHIMGTTARFTGKYYFEMKPASTSFTSVGVTGAAGHVKRGNGALFGEGLYGGQIGFQPNGNVRANPSGPYTTGGSTITTIQTWTTNNVISVAVDIDNNLLWFRTNAGNWNNNGANDPATGVGGIDLSYAWSGAANRLLWPGANMGNTSAIILREITADFTQTVPSGYLSWSGL